MRFADLGNRPQGLFRDEAEKGYNAWSLATTGGVVELTGRMRGAAPEVRWRAWPWTLDVMGARTSAIYQYVDALFMRIGGLRITTTRMAAALAGTLTVALLGALMMRAWGPWRGLAIAAWLALCPWHLVFSRWAQQGIFVPLWIALTLMGLWGFERERRWGAPTAGIGLGWMFYTYSGAQPFVLAWGFCLAVLYGRRARHGGWPLAVGAALFLIPVLPTVIAHFGAGGAGRLAAVAVWNDPAHASAWGVATQFLWNYRVHFNPGFFFMSGDPQPRHCIPGMGQMMSIDMLLLPIGLVWTLWRRVPLRGALIAAFLCGPLPAALTNIRGIPHGLRALPMLLPAVVWSGVGLAALAAAARDWTATRRWRSVRPGFFMAGVIAICLGLGLAGFGRYWRLYRWDPRVWVAFEMGERESWKTINRLREPGQRIYIALNVLYAPHFQLFFQRRDPRQTARAGLGTDGVFYYRSELTSPSDRYRMLAPGDWMIERCSPTDAIDTNTGKSMIGVEQVMGIGEFWVRCTQKPPAAPSDAPPESNPSHPRESP